jgi:hypothetical protein
MSSQEQRSLSTEWLWLVLTIVVITSALVFHLPAGFRWPGPSHGHRVQPMLEAQYLYSSQDQPAKKWRVVYVTADKCGAHCEQVDYQLHQMRKALGAAREQVDVVRLENSAMPVAKLQQAFTTRQRSVFEVTEKVYLIDPVGKLFMYYPAATDPQHVLKDMKHVLEVSQLG